MTTQTQFDQLKIVFLMLLKSISFANMSDIEHF